jgi:hypothetical protein
MSLPANFAAVRRGALMRVPSRLPFDPNPRRLELPTLTERSLPLSVSCYCPHSDVIMSNRTTRPWAVGASDAQHAIKVGMSRPPPNDGQQSVLVNISVPEINPIHCLRLTDYPTVQRASSHLKIAHTLRIAPWERLLPKLVPTSSQVCLRMPNMLR